MCDDGCMHKDILVQNGLSEKEAELYLTVLEAGELTHSQAAKKSGLKRSTVYSLVEGHKDKRILSTHNRRGIKYISALAPRLLIEHFENSTEMAKSILPQLVDLAYRSPIKPRIRFYDGIDGIKHILFDASSSTNDYFGLTDYHLMPREVYQYIQRKVVPQRKKHHVVLRLLVPENETNRRILQEYTQCVEHKMISFPSRKNHIEILLFHGSKIGFLSFVKGEMFGVVIDSEAIYQTLHDLFMVVWGQVE
jgi:HTH-type transcriptional regulator, sugar sensing transcriptional regulator